MLGSGLYNNKAKQLPGSYVTFQVNKNTRNASYTGGYDDNPSGGNASGTTSVGARISEVKLLANSWVGNSSPYSQVVTIKGVTRNSQVDLTPSVEQLVVFYEKDLAFVTENENGVVTVYAIGQKPQNDYTIQVTITEVEYE